MIMKRLLALLFCAALSSTAIAQSPQNWTSAEMYQAIRKLNVLGTVLYVAAHPDDENTRLITYFAKDRLLHTGYLSLTRGDGGQNLIGDEQGIGLGLIRTQELLSARRIDGGEQFFTRAYDFGYSKTPEETFTKWGREKILADVVWVIRKFRPDVIITRFPTTGEGGHGHHTASAILANEAFRAAADPSQFPGQLQYVEPWQARRILWNTFNFGNTNLTRPDQFKFDVGGYNPLLGKSYGEIAAASRSQHKSQGFGVPASRGEALEYFTNTDGPAPSKDIMEGVEMSWSRVKGGLHIGHIVDSIAGSFDFLQPEKSVSGLLRLYRALLEIPDGYWRDRKLEETRELIVQCSGLYMEATVNTAQVVQGDSARISFSINSRRGIEGFLTELSVPGIFEKPYHLALPPNKNINLTHDVMIGENVPVSQPYWLREKMEEGNYTVSSAVQIGQPDIDPPLQAGIRMLLGGESFAFTLPVRYKFTDPVRGEIYQPPIILPRVMVSTDNDLKLTRDGNDFRGTLFFETRSKSNEVTVRDIRISPEGPQYGFEPQHLRLGPNERQREVAYRIQGKSNQEYAFYIDDSQPATGKSGTNGGGDPKNAAAHPAFHLRQIGYDHIPTIAYFEKAQVKNVRLNLETHHRKIGYITGAGDKVPEALELMGYEVVLLTDKELSRNNLSQFDAILTGVRAYNTNEWMNRYYDKLMQYVEQGGNLVVQYNTSGNLGPVRARIGPYPFTIGRTRVSVEDAPVRLLNPKHPVFNFPNKITEDDFRGWIQERSVYHAASWDSTKYETVLSMNDPGEKPDEGSLIIARHGKGVFVYTGIVFFRQLPAGVEGAYRFLANILALNRKKGF